MSEEDEKTKNKQIKIVICGDVKVGKTCLLARFTDKEFLENPISTSSDFIQKKIKKNNNIYELNIWDTAGQEKFQSLNKIFFKGAQIAILVYDITNKTSFEALNNYWLKQVLENSSKNIILYIIANKSDLINLEQVDEEEARNYSKSINASFFVVSAKDSISINELFKDIAKKYSGAKNVKIIDVSDDDNNDFQIKKIRKNSVKITKKAIAKDKKKKSCC